MSKHRIFYPDKLDILPSLLTTKAAESVDAQSDLEVPDPAPETARASIEAHFTPSGKPVNR